MKKILVIDGNSIINRAYYGVRPLSTTQGKPTGAIFGMVNIIYAQLEKLRPDYAAVAFDLKVPTFRHKLYSEYKAGRHPTPDDLLAQFDDAKQCLSLMGLHVLELPGYEADDIQGTVAGFAHRTEDTESYILTGDRDLYQLIDDKVTVLYAANTGVVPMHREEFVDKYHVEPSEFVDMKALMGDSSDNIPGVAGIGEKTAGTLIQDFHSLEGIYRNIDDPRIKKSAREKLLAGQDSAYLCRRLAKIETEAPLPCSLADLTYHGIDRAGLYAKFSELELKSLIARLGLNKDATAPSAPAVPTPTENSTATVTDAETFLMVDEAHLPPLPARLAVAVKGDELYFSDGDRSYRLAGGWQAAAPLFRGKRDIVCTEGKHLLHALDRAGIAVDDGIRLLDLRVYAYVLNPGSGTPGIPELCAGFLGETPDADLPCPARMLRLEDAMRQKIRADGEERILDELEIPLIPVLFAMEREGLMIDTAGMCAFGDALGKLANELTLRIYTQAGEEFNINSPKQLGEVLFERMGLYCGKKKTKTGYSTDAETLEDLRGDSPIVEDILEYRQVTKLRSTYAIALVEAADEQQRVHTDFKQTLTATGRLSSADPNLQNIPIRTKMGREMRRYFIAREGWQLVDADYSQIELRLLAEISGDYHMTEAFIHGEDIHRKTAAAVFGVPEEDVTESQRKHAKAVNFGIVYGIGGYSLAKDIGTSVAEAKRYIQNYKYNYPGIDAYLDRVVEEAKANGYTTTPMGRRRYIPELTMQKRNMQEFGKRVAMNAPIQGAAADMIKLAMIRVFHRLRAEGLRARLVMQVHDELLVEAPQDEVQTVKRLLREEMTHMKGLRVPLTVDVTSGDNWLEQHE